MLFRPSDRLYVYVGGGGEEEEARDDSVLHLLRSLNVFIVTQDRQLARSLARLAERSSSSERKKERGIAQEGLLPSLAFRQMSGRA